MLRADEQTWLKTGVEFFEGRPRLSTVLTFGRSSWMVTDLPGGSEDILLRVSRRGDAVEVRYLVGDGQPELAALVFMPPGLPVLAGVMCAAPEGPGFRISFHDLQITEPDWSAAAGEAGEWAAEPGWPADGTGPSRVGEGGGQEWSGENGTPAAEPSAWDKGEEPAPAWDGGHQASERRDWASGAASEDHPSWPAGGVTPVDVTPADKPDWDGDAPAEEELDWPEPEDDPDWPKKLAMEDDPDWAIEAAADAADAASGVESPKDGPGGAPAGQLAKPDDPPAGPEPAPPGEPAADDHQTWAPAPTIEDAVADWDRLAAGVHSGQRAAEPAEPWTAQTDADVANEWPGPPLRAARRAAIASGLSAGDEAGPEPPAPAGSESGAGPASGQPGPGEAAAGPKQPAHAKRRKSAPSRPPVDLAGPPDPADEWISLLTADPAEE
jgi:hypothetical protein